MRLYEIQFRRNVNDWTFSCTISFCCWFFVYVSLFPHCFVRFTIFASLIRMCIFFFFFFWTHLRARIYFSAKFVFRTPQLIKRKSSIHSQNTYEFCIYTYNVNHNHKAKAQTYTLTQFVCCWAIFNRILKRKSSVVVFFLTTKCD